METILLGGSVVAVLDIANAMTFWALYRGTRPEVILQSVAAGVLGPAAFSGGAGSAGLGAFLHLFIACGIAAVYYGACLRWQVLIRRAVFSGAAYGVVVYLVMNYIVVPLSRARPAALSPAWFLDNFIGHVLLVGLPVAFIARRSAVRSQP